MQVQVGIHLLVCIDTIFSRKSFGHLEKCHLIHSLTTASSLRTLRCTSPGTAPTKAAAGFIIRVTFHMLHTRPTTARSSSWLTRGGEGCQGGLRLRRGSCLGRPSTPRGSLLLPSACSWPGRLFDVTVIINLFHIGIIVGVLCLLGRGTTRAGGTSGGLRWCLRLSVAHVLNLGIRVVSAAGSGLAGRGFLRSCLLGRGTFLGRRIFEIIIKVIVGIIILFTRLGSGLFGCRCNPRLFLRGTLLLLRVAHRVIILRICSLPRSCTLA
mmetsp:Transcript_23403/g.50685  ORF Transcript_23403/g.50685 Transcript_23403/m.50685 type:complete len:267 (-) Transcript_23403:546-1346(-)